jgi:hypothetical protein
MGPDYVSPPDMTWPKRTSWQPAGLANHKPTNLQETYYG